MKIKKEVITVQQETTVDFLKNPEVSFVSLVRHGANNTPFRVIKSNKGGGTMNKVVQAIRVLKDSKVDLKSLVGEDFRKDTVKVDGNYLIYEQVDKSVCDPDTKSVVVIDPANHVYAITYELLADQSSKDLGTVQKTVVIKEDVKELDYWDVWSELYSMMDFISGTIGQSNRTTNDQKDLILSAVDNFRAFCETVFSEVKSITPMSMEKKAEGTAKIMEILQKQIVEKTNKENTMFELESKDELVQMITGAVDSAMTKKAAEDAKSTEVTAKAEADAAALEVREKEMEELKTSVKGLSESFDKISGTIVSKTAKVDVEGNPIIEKESVYSGMFPGLRSTPVGISGQA
jgi:hypothetical protein